MAKRKSIMYKLLFFSFFSLLISNLTYSQDKESHVIQFSGVVVTTDEFGEMVPLPYTTVAIQGTPRGTYAEVDGFFSVVAEVGDTIVFSRIGYQTTKHGISDTLTSGFYSWYQIMTKDNVLLPEAVIYPWPSRDHYKIEFLAMDVSNELRQRAKENLAKELLEKMQQAVPVDGSEAYSLAMKQQVEEFKYSGQYKPQNIFNIASWAQFVKAWKRGDFKNKKKKKTTEN